MNRDLLLLTHDEDDESLLEAEIQGGLMRLKVEQEDPQGERGDIVRVHFFPTKAQARSLAEMLSRWAQGKG